MDLSTIILSAAIGLATGVVAGIVTWWILFRHLAPRFSLDERLNHFRLEGDGAPRSQVRLSVGSRAMVEMRLTMSLRIPDLVKEGSAESIRLHRRGTDYLEAEKKLRYRIRVDLMPRETFQRYRPYLKPRVVEHIAHKKPLDLKILFEEHPRAEIVVTLLARDAFTGAAGVTQRRYGVDSLTEGRLWDE
jgi:hypothetical protein